jgi:nucleoid-associated protein YgaU
MVSRIPVVELLKQEKEKYLKSLVASSRNVRSVKERLANGQEQDYVTDGGGIGLTPYSVPSTTPVKNPTRIHEVQRGDTLFKLAREYYNDTSRWRGIYKANQAVLPNEHSLTPGQLLSIP